MRKRKEFKLPLEFQDASADLDRRLELIGNLCLAAGDTEECDEHLVREVGHEIREYLRARNALEHIFGRVAYHNDADYFALVRNFRRRMGLR